MMIKDEEDSLEDRFPAVRQENKIAARVEVYNSK